MEEENEQQSGAESDLLQSEGFNNYVNKIDNERSKDKDRLQKVNDIVEGYMIKSKESNKYEIGM